MNTEQHASSILAAWELADRSTVEIALNRALASCRATRSISSLESERQEVLQSVAEHLRALAGNGRFPAYSQGSGALTLLFHLSASLLRKDGFESAFQDCERKTLKFGAKRSKCFVEVECRPRG